MSDGAPEPRRPWHPATRVGFRFLFLYLVLYALPFPFTAVTGFFPPLAEWYGGLWNRVATRVGPSVLGLDVVIQPTGSGDTALAYTLVFCFLVTALLGTVVWTVLDRDREAYPLLHDLLRTYLRFMLGATMLTYGAVKIIKTQFPEPSLVRMLEPLGNGSPMGLLWKFMGYSVAMNLFAGLGEFVGGVLLFFRRTTTLGALLLIAVLSNVVVMNYAYDVPVKLYSSHLLAVALFLTLPDARRLLDVLLFNRPTAPRPLGALPLEGRWRTAAVAAKALLIAWLVWSPLKIAAGFSRQMADRPALYGIWEAETFVRNGDTLPPLLTDDRRWRRLIVDRGMATVQTMTSPLQGDGALRFRWQADTVAGTFRLEPASGGEAASFTFTRQKADVLEARGTWRGDSLALGLRRFDEGTFLLNSRGYNWIAELPFNR